MSRAARALQWTLAVAGALAAAWTVGAWGAGRPAGLLSYGGEVTAGDGALLLGEGAWVSLGYGTELTVQLSLDGRTLDLLQGDGADLYHFAHIEGGGVTIHDASGEALSTGGTIEGLRPGGASVRFACEPPLVVEVDGRLVERAEPARRARANRSCSPLPLGVRAVTPLRLEGVTIDGERIPIAGTAMDTRGAITTGAAVLATAAALGPAGFAVLLLSPLTGLLAGFGVPPLSGLWLLYGAGASERLVGGEGWRRLAAGGLCLLSLGMAGWIWLGSIGPIGIEATDSENVLVSGALKATMGLGAYQAKVDQAVEYYGPQLARWDGQKPLVVTLGSSSTGGNHPQGFWPSILRSELPSVHVQTLAWGGATSWHMRKILDALEVQADVCVLFMGHNDTIASTPRQSIASLERGEPPYSEGFVPPVPLPEAEENLRYMATHHCRHFVGMEEYSIGREADLDAYAEMMDRMPEVSYLDVAGPLSQRPASQMMVDPVHPSPAGQVVVGELAAERVRELLDL